jgi:monoamine oxidase
MKENERVSFSLREAEKLFPEIRTRFKLGASKCWEEDEWSGVPILVCSLGK